MTRTDEQATRTGSRLRCATCGTEIVVVRPPAAELVCCGAPMGPRSAS